MRVGGGGRRGDVAIFGTASTTYRWKSLGSVFFTLSISTTQAGSRIATIRLCGMLSTDDQRLVFKELEAKLGLKDVEETDEQGKSHLFRAIERKDLDTVKQLLSIGANPNATHPAGTMLSLAVHVGHDEAC